LIQRFRHQADSEERLSGFVQHLHLPFRVFGEFAGNAADHVAANAGQFFPRGVAIGELGAKLGRAGVAAVSDAKEIERHGVKPMREGRSRPVKNHVEFLSLDS